MKSLPEGWNEKNLDNKLEQIYREEVIRIEKIDYKTKHTFVLEKATNQLEQSLKGKNYIRIGYDGIHKTGKLTYCAPIRC